VSDPVGLKAMHAIYSPGDRLDHRTCYEFAARRSTVAPNHPALPPLALHGSVATVNSAPQAVPFAIPEWVARLVVPGAATQVME
jgi:hypothetical protein